MSFEDIRKNVVESNFKGKIFSREDLIKFHPCDLHFLFSDSKNIFLLKQKDEKLIRYKLIYWSTQRGWEDVKNN
uniref:hypothetical protein n=1 Tax=Gelidibacter sp. TaxID=2018083 RepID=UPI00404AC328